MAGSNEMTVATPDEARAMPRLAGVHETGF